MLMSTKQRPLVAVTGLVATGLVVLCGCSALRREVRRRRERAEDIKRFAKQHEERLRELAAASSETMTRPDTIDMDDFHYSEQLRTALILIFYGSESGNAEEFAKELVRIIYDHGMIAMLVNPDRRRVALGYFEELPKSPGREQCVLFVVATTGEGQAPANFIPVLQALKGTAASLAALPLGQPKPLHNMPYSVFALGDSSYKYYCRAGVETNAALQACGARELAPIAMGDARSGDEEEIFKEWANNVMREYHRLHPLLASARYSDRPRSLRVGTYETYSRDQERLRYGNTVPELPFLPPSNPTMKPSKEYPIQLKVLAKLQLNPPRDSDGSCIYRISVNVAGTSIRFEGGDHLGVFPTNPPEVVQRCVERLKLSDELLESVMELREPKWNSYYTSEDENGYESGYVFPPPPSSKHGPSVFPSRVTLREVLTHYIDLCGKPKRGALEDCANRCHDEDEKSAFLKELASYRTGESGRTGSDPRVIGDGSNGSTTPNATTIVTILDYLERYQSCGITVPEFLVLMPHIQPRYYSIASDPMSHGSVIDILVRVQRGGLCGGYLSDRVAVGESLFGFVRTSAFHVTPAMMPHPMLMIGAGTGIAPIIGLSCRREAALRCRRLSSNNCVVFFGAQHRAHEYFVVEELERWALPVEAMKERDAAKPESRGALAVRKFPFPNELTSSVISLLGMAFSRDRPEKHYVTHLIDEHRDAVYDILSGKGTVFVSGDAASMGKDVNSALEKVLQEKGGMSFEEASAFLTTMEKEHRYRKDLY